MIEKYYHSILDQVYRKLGQEEHNVALAKYSNDFSIQNFQVQEELLDTDKVHFVKYEFRGAEWVGPYDPFLGIIKEMFTAYETCSFDEFMERCEVYVLHRPISVHIWRQANVQGKRGFSIMRWNMNAAV